MAMAPLPTAEATDDIAFVNPRSALGSADYTILPTLPSMLEPPFDATPNTAPLSLSLLQ